MVLFEPTQKRWAEVEADVRVVIGRAIGKLDKPVWFVALKVNPLVPVVKRRGAPLPFDDPGPGIFTRRLIEVTVNDERGHS
jgi:hypothetical protein